MGRLRKTISINDLQNAMHVIKSAMACISQEDISKPAYKPTPEMIKKAQQKYYEKNKEKYGAKVRIYQKKKRN